MSCTSHKIPYLFTSIKSLIALSNELKSRCVKYLVDYSYIIIIQSKDEYVIIQNIGVT